MSVGARPFELCTQSVSPVS